VKYLDVPLEVIKQLGSVGYTPIYPIYT